MIRWINLLSIYILLSLELPVQAAVTMIQNEPDSVYLFSYATSKDDGKSGLKFAWSADRNRWFSVANGFSYVKCDFGQWGSGKRMFRPQLMQNGTDGTWHCIWAVSESGKALAYTSSQDLLKWKSQTYFAAAERSKYMPEHVCPVAEAKVTVNGTEEVGTIQRVSYGIVEALIRFAEQKKFRQAQNNERTEQDAVRFAGLKPVKATIKVEEAGKAISNHLIGIFFEDINYAADGGLYAELIQNRDFEYSAFDNSRWNGDKAWSLLSPPDPSATEIDAALYIDTVQPIHPNNRHYMKLYIATPDAGIANEGFDGIVLKKGEKYDFSLFARYPKDKGGRCNIRIVGNNGKVYAESRLKITSTNWKKYTTVLIAQDDVKDGCLEIRPQTVGTLHLDMVSLFPQNTFKGRKNGLRADLAQVLADLHPRFVRFPGGCVAHGDGVDNIYDWKGSIGPLEARKPLRNLWGYHQTRGLGYYEYFLFCEDIGAEPVPVVAAGVPCQNSSACSHHSKGEIGCAGQQGGIPMEEMGEYIQDVLDLIEWANGDARRTKWGKLRAEAGHPEPFNLKYIGIGNEDLISDVFSERFTMLFNAVKEKYPEVTVIGTTGPFYEGTDYEEGWALATELGVPIVDEHYYVSPGWFINNQDFYDRYDRSKSKVYLGEYAAHLPGRPNNVETALAEALYLTSVERNGDIVAMTSYAPLLAKEGHTQWSPDLIYFNNTEVKPTVGYYTQQMFGCNVGNEYLPSAVTTDNRREEVGKRIGVSAVRDGESGDLIVKLVNLLPVSVEAKVEIPFLEGGEAIAEKTLLTGNPEDKEVRPESGILSVGEHFPYTMPPYSFTVLRIGQSR